MKKTSKEFMEWLGLKVGDKVKFLGDIWVVKYDENEVHEVYLHRKYVGYDQVLWLTELIDQDFEILPAPKRVGDLKCEGKCPSCPCIYVCNEEVNAGDKTLYEVLELGIATFTKTPKKMNGAIYDVIKSQLDKEVKDNE